MCGFVNLDEQISDPEIQENEFEGQEEVNQGIYAGIFSPFELPESLYLFYFLELVRQMNSAYGLPTDFSANSQRRIIATIAKNNLSIFSGAKTFQHVLELSLSIFDENDQLRSLSDFQNVATSINDTYNKAWLKSELSAAFRQSQAIASWQQIQDEKELFPLLQYVTVGDERVRPQHRNLDGIIKPVDDVFWDRWFPPNGWRCRCVVSSLEDGIISNIDTPVNEDDNFDTNVGNTGFIFKNTHPYNDVPPEFQEQKDNNFGFTVPTDTDIRDFLNDQ